MSYENWKNKAQGFQTVDVRHIQGSFFEGLHIIQTFEPVPLYPVLALMGFEHHTEKVSGSEYHIWFYRVRKGE